MVQGGHAVWKSGKTGKMAKTNSLLGKIREFQNLKKNQGIIREFHFWISVATLW